MSERLKNKKLLVLGSTKLIASIVQKAKDMGVFVGVTDSRPLEQAPAKNIADAYYFIDFSHEDEVVELIKKEQYDGLLTGFTDSYMEYYLRICQKAGLPCCGNNNSIQIAIDKSAFKKACKENNVPVIPGITVSCYDEALDFAKKIGYPLMLKPIDNSGSRGVIKCEGEGELKSAYEYALSFSKAKMVIVEKYLDCDNMAVSYFAADGEIRISTTDDRKVYVSEESGSSVSSYSVYPSKYTERYIKEVNDNVISMLKNNGFDNGMISLQAFVDEHSFYFCEMCYRTSGGQHYILTKDQNDIDQLALLIEYAVTGNCRKSWDCEKETPFFKENIAMLRVIGTPGKIIKRLEGFEEIKSDKSVITAYSSKNIGDEIGKSGTTAQVVGNVLYRFSKDEDPHAAADKIISRLSVKDENGESIIWYSID